MSEIRTQWKAYLLYLKMWADSHDDPAFIGTCPVCFDEFLDFEYHQMKEE